MFISIKKCLSCVGGGLFVGGSVLRIIDNYILVSPNALGIDFEITATEAPR